MCAFLWGILKKCNIQAPCWWKRTDFHLCDVSTSITSVSLTHFLLLNVLTAVTSSTLLHVGFGNHTSYYKRVHDNSSRLLQSLWEITWVRFWETGQEGGSCVFMCVQVCILLYYFNKQHKQFLHGGPGHHSPVFCQTEVNSESPRINRECPCSSTGLCRLVNTAVPCCFSHCNNFPFWGHRTNWLWSRNHCRAAYNLQEMLFFDAVAPEEPPRICSTYNYLMHPTSEAHHQWAAPPDASLCVFTGT